MRYLPGTRTTQGDSTPNSSLSPTRPGSTATPTCCHSAPGRCTASMIRPVVPSWPEYHMRSVPSGSSRTQGLLARTLSGSPGDPGEKTSPSRVHSTVRSSLSVPTSRSWGQGCFALQRHASVGLDVVHRRAACTEDFDPAGLGLLNHGDGDREHAVFARGGEVVAVKALSEEQLTAELALCPLSDLDLIALGREPAAGCPHAEDIVLDRQFDRVGIHARQVEMNLELVATTVCVHRDLPNWILASHLLTHPFELTERLESHQHGGIPFSGPRSGWRSVTAELRCLHPIPVTRR